MLQAHQGWEQVWKGWDQENLERGPWGENPGRTRKEWLAVKSQSLDWARRGSLGGFKQFNQCRRWELHWKALRCRWAFSRSRCEDEKDFTELEMAKYFTLKLLCGVLVFSQNRDGCLVLPMDPAERSICRDCAPDPVPICISPSNLPAVWTRGPSDLLGSDLSGRSHFENYWDKEFVVPKALIPFWRPNSPSYGGSYQCAQL